MERQEYFINKKKAKKSIMIVSIILVGIVAWWALTVFMWEFSWFNTIFFGIIFALFLLPLIITISKMNKNIPALIISEEGVEETLSGVKDHVHPWSTIEKVGRKKIFARMHIIVFIENPYQFIESQSGRVKKSLNSMYGQAGSPVTIPVDFVDGDADVIFNQIRAQIRKHRGLNEADEADDSASEE